MVLTAKMVLMAKTEPMAKTVLTAKMEPMVPQ